VAVGQAWMNDDVHTSSVRRGPLDIVNCTTPLRCRLKLLPPSPAVAFAYCAHFSPHFFTFMTLSLFSSFYCCSCSCCSLLNFTGFRSNFNISACQLKPACLSIARRFAKGDTTWYMLRQFHPSSVCPSIEPTIALA